MAMAVVVVGKQGAYLDVLDDTVVAKVAARRVARGGEGIGSNVQQRAVAAIGDVERSHRDWGRLAGAWVAQQDDKRREAKDIHLVWSRRYRAPASPALLWTAPMAARRLW